MKRTSRAHLARETVAICDAGRYETATGDVVSIEAALAKAKAGTRLYSPENPLVVPESKGTRNTHFSVRNESTFEALARLASEGSGHLACLNFASAKNPGGGFLNGSLAQEEALACASALYPCLLTAPDYYSRNRANRSTLYLDLIIFSPGVPFFRNDAGILIAQPVLASVITAPAPNAGAVAMNEPENLGKIHGTLQRRAELVLATAQAHQVDNLVLGAWGCGVFRNDPRQVAGVFADLLKSEGKFAGIFATVAFAVLDHSENAETYRAFADEFEERDVKTAFEQSI